MPSSAERLSQLESENETLRQQLAEDMEGRKAEMVKSVAGIQESIRKAEDGTRAAVSALGERQVQVSASALLGIFNLALLYMLRGRKESQSSGTESTRMGLSGPQGSCPQD